MYPEYSLAGEEGDMNLLPLQTIPLTGLMFRKRIELTLRKTRIETDRPWEDRLFGKY